MRKPILFSSILLMLTALFTTWAAQAQDDRPEMADALRANGKIGVVVAVLAIIFAGIFAYLIRLDRKLSRLEREVR